MNDQNILALLEKVVHPESGENLVSAGMVKKLTVTDDSVHLTITLKRARDPLANALKRDIIKHITERFPSAEGRITIFMEEPPVKSTKTKEVKAAGGINGIKRVIAIASGKGGVGKSTVTANLAVTLSSMGYKVGVLDADIYGPSQPTLFGVTDFQPPVHKDGDKDLMLPAFSRGIKIMSIGFFINPSDALIWRGPMATSALKQLIHQTLWGDLDFLLIDLPPGTGDVHLTVLQELKIDGALMVSTPQKIALADVVRGIAMFTAEKISIPVLGIIENMSWFTPVELPSNRYYIFGKDGVEKLAVEHGLKLLGKIPLVLPKDTSADQAIVWSVDNEVLKNNYTSIAQKIIAI